MNNNVLPDRIREKRRSMKMTQADLAEQLGVSEMTVRRWESGKSSPRIEEVNRLAKLLGSTVDYLMGTGEFNEVQSNKLQEERETSPSIAYWGGVVDNARNVAKYGNESDIADVIQMLKLALSSLVNISVGQGRRQPAIA